MPEEIRRITGPSEAQPFGRLTRLAAMPDGGVVVFDEKAADGAALLRFDSTGTFVHRIGRTGAGPGEYPSTLATLASLDAAPDGEVFLLDGMSNRWIRYDSAGRHVRTIPLRTRSRHQVFVATIDGGVCISDDEVPQTTMGRAPVRCLDASGATTDSIADIAPWGGAISSDPVTNYTMWTVTRDRRVVHMHIDRVGFLLLDHPRDAARPSHRPLLRAAEIGAEPVRYGKGEREEERRFAAWHARGTGRAPREVPESKPLTGGMTVDLDGRLWVQRRSPAVPIPPEMKFWGTVNGRTSEITTAYAEPPHFAVFDTLGVFLGELHFPAKAIVQATGRTVWAVVPGEDDVPVLVQYRLNARRE